MFQPKKLDLTRTKTFSAANRHNLVRIDTLRTPGQQEDDLFASPEFTVLIEKLDAAQKASDVQLQKLYPPPSETNFGGGLLSGTQSVCDAACAAFAEAVKEVAARPIDK